MYNLVAFSTFTMLSNLCHCISRTFSSPQEETTYALSSPSPFPPTLSPWQPLICSDSVLSPAPGISYKWTQPPSQLVSTRSSADRADGLHLGSLPPQVHGLPSTFHNDMGFQRSLCVSAAHSSRILPSGGVGAGRGDLGSGWGGMRWSGTEAPWHS